MKVILYCSWKGLHLPNNIFLRIGTEEEGDGGVGMLFLISWKQNKHLLLLLSSRQNKQTICSLYSLKINLKALGRRLLQRMQQPGLTGPQQILERAYKVDTDIAIHGELTVYLKEIL